METLFVGRGILNPNEGTNYKVLKEEPNLQGQTPKHKGQKLIIPAGAGIQFQVNHASDGKPDTVYVAKVFRQQHTPHVHTPGFVIFRGEKEIAVNIGPEKREINHPVLGNIQYIP